MSLQILRKGENEMAKKEVKTDLWVARQLDDSKIKYDAQGSDVKEINDALQSAWNQYQFETYAPMITKKAVIPSGKQASFERNRNLFYVCCSRPKKRLIFFVTVPIDSTFKSFLVELVGEQNIFTFSQYIERKSIK